jgi:hypothetical protein
MKSKTLVLPLAAAGIGCLVAVTAFASSAAPQQYAQYKNDRWHFALAAPADMKVETFDYPGGGQQFSFSNTSGTELFTCRNLDLT